MSRRDQEMFPASARFACLVALAFFLGGCDPPQSQVDKQVKKNTNPTPIGCATQPCPDAILVQVEVIDEDIDEPIRNTTVKIKFADGRVVPVVTDDKGIAAVTVKPGDKFDVIVDDLHKITDKHEPR